MRDGRCAGHAQSRAATGSIFTPPRRQHFNLRCRYDRASTPQLQGCFLLAEAAVSTGCGTCTRRTWVTSCQEKTLSTSEQSSELAPRVEWPCNLKWGRPGDAEQLLAMGSRLLARWVRTDGDARYQRTIRAQAVSRWVNSLSPLRSTPAQRALGHRPRREDAYEVWRVGVQIGLV